MLQINFLHRCLKNFKDIIFVFISSIELRVPIYEDNKGAIGILTTLVLGIVLVMLAITIVLTGISSRTNAFVMNQSEKTFIGMEGCIEDALVRLSRDNTYAGGIYSVGDVDCEAVISGPDPNRQIVVTGTQDTITRDAVLSVQLAPSFGIIEWAE